MLAEYNTQLSKSTSGADMLTSFISSGSSFKFCRKGAEMSTEFCGPRFGVGLLITNYQIINSMQQQPINLCMIQIGLFRSSDSAYFHTIANLVSHYVKLACSMEYYISNVRELWDVAPPTQVGRVMRF